MFSANEKKVGVLTQEPQASQGPREPQEPQGPREPQEPQGPQEPQVAQVPQEPQECQEPNQEEESLDNRSLKAPTPSAPPADDDDDDGGFDWGDEEDDDEDMGDGYGYEEEPTDDERDRDSNPSVVEAADARREIQQPLLQDYEEWDEEMLRAEFRQMTAGVMSRYLEQDEEEEKKEEEAETEPEEVINWIASDIDNIEVE